MQQKVLVILNDPPYGTERSYNGLRLAGALSRSDEAEVRVFLVGDAVGCAASNQRVPDGYYHLDQMIESVRVTAATSAAAGRASMLGGSRRIDSPRAPTDLPSRSSPRGACGRTKS